MARTKFVAGNWKMNKDRAEALALVSKLVGWSEELEGDVEVVIAPPYPFLEMAVQCTHGTRIKVAAQNCHQKEQGAFTGEVSPLMLADLGCRYVLVGHSERRQFFGETDATVKKKIGEPGTSPADADVVGVSWASGRGSSCMRRACRGMRSP